MAAQISLDTIPLDVETIEPIPIDPAALPDCYPYPLLAKTGRRQTIEVRTVVMENPYLRIVVALDLGGRILGLFDKRTATAIIETPSSLVAREGGPRGVSWDHGIQMLCGSEERPNTLGPVDWSVPEAGEGEEVYLWLFELIAGQGLSWHAKITLPPDAAEFQIETTAFNRTMEPRPIRLGWTVALPHAGAVHTQLSPALQSGDRGMAFGAIEDEPPARVEVAREQTFEALAYAGTLAARKVRKAGLLVRPFSGISRLHADSRWASLQLEEQRVTIQARCRIDSTRLFILTESGQTLEAPVSLDPFQMVVLDLPEPISALTIRDAERNELLSHSFDETPRPETRSRAGAPSDFGQSLSSAFRESPPDRDLLLDALRFDDPPSAVRIGQAIRAIDLGDLERAETRLVDALCTNAEDPLLWWLRAAIARKRGRDSDDLLNAHYLAPLEPTLRAESLLGQPRAEGSDANPLIASLAENPEYLVEIACLYLEARLFDDAHRWIDEALRHRDHPMLHLLAAWGLLQRTGLAVEAAGEVAKASAKPIVPPFPWRGIERIALADLARRFPEDERLRQMRQLAGP